MNTQEFNVCNRRLLVDLIENVGYSHFLKFKHLVYLV